MKRKISGKFTSLAMALFLSAGTTLAAELTPVNYPIKSVYSAPSEDSNLIYRIPIEINLLDVSPDGNWYKIRLSYRIGPLCPTFVGWAKIPVGDIMAQREKEPTEISAEEPPAVAQKQ